MILVVTYELKSAIGAYSALFDVMKAENSWAHYMDSTWFVATSDTPKDFSKKLIPHLSDGDRIMVTALTTGYAGWLPRKAWDWIKRHIEDGEIPSG